jgi:hypothetical protein
VEHAQGVVTWEKHKGRYYGACQRRKEACLGKKYIREDHAEEKIVNMLERLVSPSEQMIQWVTSTLRARHETETDSREEAIAALRSKIDRVERMDDVLYDDKLAGYIPQEKYIDKHERFLAEKAELIEQLGRLDVSRELQFGYGLTILEHSPKKLRKSTHKRHLSKNVSF